jgi:hypothetical protein
LRLHINDANILIDIIKLELQKEFLSLKFDFYTTDFIFSELNLEQQKILKSKKLKILKPVVNEIIEIYDLKNLHNGLSIEDCSVWYFAKKLNGIFLTLVLLFSNEI